MAIGFLLGVRGKKLPSRVMNWPTEKKEAAKPKSLKASKNRRYINQEEQGS